MTAWVETCGTCYDTPVPDCSLYELPNDWDWDDDDFTGYAICPACVARGIAGARARLGLGPMELARVSRANWFEP